MPRPNALRNITRAELQAAMNSPWGRAVMTIGFSLIITALQAANHPAARVAARILVAVSSMDKFPDARSWALKELPKLDKALHKLQVQNPNLSSLRVVLRNVINYLKKSPQGT